MLRAPLIETRPKLELTLSTPPLIAGTKSARLSAGRLLMLVMLGGFESLSRRSLVNISYDYDITAPKIQAARRGLDQSTANVLLDRL